MLVNCAQKFVLRICLFFEISGSGTARGTSFFGWNVKNISKFCQMITCYGIEMPDISKEPFNQEVFWKMVGFLTDVLNKMSSFKNWSNTKFWAQFTNITFGKFNIGTAPNFKRGLEVFWLLWIKWSGWKCGMHTFAFSETFSRPQIFSHFFLRYSFFGHLKNPFGAL